MKHIWLLDNSLRVDVYYDGGDSDFSDNVCVSFREVASADEKIFRVDETNIYLTPAQANQLALALIQAAKHSMGMQSAEINIDDPS
ncbi:MAG: hypothetical protein R3E31_25365 [Chloroflexota bacterium]|nr:hypothetical protein [Anaerolineales bacterium]MCB8965441.1 hypothetical protein [Ardenticatenaceae bacterium]